MKQEITQKQWRELSERSQLEIAKRYGDGIEKPEFWVNNPSVYINLSIGQMIEFLGDDYINVLYKYDNGNPAWTEHVCDALWESVKEVLEKEEE